MQFFKPFETPTGASIPAREINLRDFGAVEGGAVKNTEIIRNAVEALAREGGGRLVFPAGKWLTGPIHFKSGVEIHLEKDCEVLFSTDPDDYLPAVFTLFEGMRCYTYSAQLYAHNCHDIAVTGEGTFNGQGFVWWYVAAMTRRGVEDMHEQGEAGLPPENRVYDDLYRDGVRPGLLQFINCQNVTIEGCTFRFSPFWTVHPTWCENVIVRNIRVINPPHHAPNTDACNLEGCRRGLVDGVWADTGDDCVCIKSGRDRDGREQGRPCEDIILRNLIAERSHGGITIGSEMSGGVNNIYIENCEFRNNLVGIFIKTAPERGGYVRNIEYHNIRTGTMREHAICFTMGYYMDSSQFTSTPTMPVVENILVENFEGACSGEAVKIGGFEGYPMKNIHLKKVSIRARQNISIGAVENLNLENVTF